LVTKGNIKNGLAQKRDADARASPGFEIRALRGKGFASLSAVARELNERGTPSARGGKAANGIQSPFAAWHHARR